MKSKSTTNTEQIKNEFNELNDRIIKNNIDAISMYKNIFIESDYLKNFAKEEVRKIIQNKNSIFQEVGKCYLTIESSCTKSSDLDELESLIIEKVAVTALSTLIDHKASGKHIVKFFKPFCTYNDLHDDRSVFLKLYNSNYKTDISERFLSKVMHHLSLDQLNTITESLKSYKTSEVSVHQDVITAIKSYAHGANENFKSTNLKFVHQNVEVDDCIDTYHTSNQNDNNQKDDDKQNVTNKEVKILDNKQNVTNKEVKILDNKQNVTNKEVKILPDKLVKISNEEEFEALVNYVGSMTKEEKNNCNILFSILHLLKNLDEKYHSLEEIVKTIINIEHRIYRISSDKEIKISMVKSLCKIYECVKLLKLDIICKELDLAILEVDPLCDSNSMYYGNPKYINDYSTDTDTSVVLLAQAMDDAMEIA